MLNPDNIYACTTCNGEFDGHSVNHCARCGSITCTECMPTGIGYLPICKACSDATALTESVVVDPDPELEIGGINRDFSAQEEF